MGQSGAQQKVSAEECVRTEWISHLPGERQQLFRDVVVSLEASYTMMSVALDEAMLLVERALTRFEVGTTVTVYTDPPSVYTYDHSKPTPDIEDEDEE